LFRFSWKAGESVYVTQWHFVLLFCHGQGRARTSNAPVGWDGRNPTLEAQAQASITSGSMSMRETDTPVKVEAIDERIGWRSNVRWPTA
jgi:hypothetical protein